MISANANIRSNIPACLPISTLMLTTVVYLIYLRISSLLERLLLVYDKNRIITPEMSEIA